MGESISCAWCSQILLDAEHARKHVAEQCKKSPHRATADALRDVYALVEEGLLVRDISLDGTPQYVARALRIVEVLQRAEAVLRGRALPLTEEVADGH